MERDTPPSQDVSTYQIWNSYLKEYRRYASDTKRDGRTDGRTVRLLYASQSSFGGMKKGLYEIVEKLNQAVDFLQTSGMILLTVCPSLQIINHAKSNRHSCMALAIANVPLQTFSIQNLLLAKLHYERDSHSQAMHQSTESYPKPSQ